MRWALCALLVLHGLIHLLGVAKAFGLAELPQLTQPISRPAGVVWLLAAATLLAAGLLLIGRPQSWWIAGLVSVALSQTVITMSWTDARLGTIPNLIVLVAALYGLASEGPVSFSSEYRRAVRDRLGGSTPTAPLTAAELSHLPEPVRRYVQGSGAVGQPRVRHFALSGRGRIREGPDDPWMDFTFRQHNVVNEPARFFQMDARRAGLPVDVFHAFVGGAATMRVRLLSMIPIVNASGPELTRAETVTLLNDLCVFAPGALVSPEIRWESVDARTARAHYTVGDNTVSAELTFNDAGELVDFVSDDRLVLEGGERYSRQRWSTPLSGYQGFGPLRLAGRGEGHWHRPDGEFSYIELEIVHARMNP